MYNLTAVLGALRLAQSLANPLPGATAGVDPVPKILEHSVLNVARKEQAQDCYVKPYDVPAQAPPFPPFDQTRANVFRYRQQQGVNLGSWFVHEQWMTPSVYGCAAGPKIAEIDIAGGWGGLSNARAVLEKHWDSFITIDDFKYLASIGINTVRIPVGHWIAGSTFMVGTPFEPFTPVYANAWPRFLRALNQADQFGIGVLVDLHGAPGSQNGQHHSGISDGKTNLFHSQAYQAKTIEFLKFLVERLGPISNIIGIQLLNEPAGDPILEDFYERAISAIREVPFYGPKMPLYIHDAFDMDRFAPFVAGRQDFVVHDHHSYFVFTDGDSKKSADQHTKDVQGGIAESLRKTAFETHRNLIIGEWSCALTTESLAHQKDKTQAQRSFCTSQAQVYTNSTAGWQFWSYRNEQCEDDMSWCFLRAVGTTLPPTFFSYDTMTTADHVRYASIKAGNLDSPTDDEIASILNQSSGEGQSHERSIGGGFTKDIQHRFEAVHQHFTLKPDQKQSQNNITSNSSSVKGCKDGYQTAKVFAMYNMSKLGFVEHYIGEAMSRAGYDQAPSETKRDYTAGFRAGLAFGERKVLDAASSQS